MPWQRTTAGPDDSFAEAVQQSLGEGRPVIAAPPWGRTKASPSQNENEDVFRNAGERHLAACRPTGPASVLLALLPAAILTSRSSQRFREVLMRTWQPSVVLFGKGVIPQAHAGFETAAILLRGRPALDDLVRIFRIPTESDALDVEQEFAALLRMRGGRKIHGYVVRDGVPPGDSLSYERHDPELLRQRMELATLGATLPLSQLFEFLPSVTHSAADRGRWPASNRGARILSGRDIGRDGAIRSPDDDALLLDLPEDRRLRPGDLVMRSIEAGTDAGGFAVAHVTADFLPAAANNTVIALRPRTTLTDHQMRFVLGFLRTPLAKKLAAEGFHDVHIQRSLLAALEVPQPDEPLTAALDELTDAALRMRDWADEAEGILDSALLDEPAVARERIVTTGRNLRMRTEAARLLDNFDHGVRTRFPHPLAYRWRRVEAEISSGDSLRAYEAVLETAEVLHCYAANLAMVMARLAGQELKSADNLRTKLTASTSGATLGDWLAILEEVGGKRFRNLPHDLPLGELRYLFDDGALHSAQARLTERRNDRAHMRHADLKVALDQSHADLTELMSSAEVLTDLKLIRIHKVNWDTFNGNAVVTYGELMGDHSVVPRRSFEYPDSRLEVDSLYVLDTSHRLHLLRPYLVGRPCPTCTHWSTFHVDRALSHGAILIKSLEHGHTIEDTQIADSLLQVGLMSSRG